MGIKNNKTIQYYMKDRTSLLTLFALTLAFAVVIILSFGVNFFFRTIDGSFWGDLAISVMLCIYCLLFGIPESKNYYKKKNEGRYQRSLIGFQEVRKEASKRDNQFNQWLTKKYYVEERRSYYLSVLSKYGDINPKVLDLDLSEVKNLLSPYKKDWGNGEITYFKTYTEEQVDIIKKILSGKIKFKKIDNDFFKTFNKKVVSSEYLYQSKKEGKEYRNYILLIFFRILMMFLISLVFSIFGLQVAKAEGASEIINRIYTTLSRIWTMLSSFVYGFSIGRTMVIDESEVLDYKTRVNTQFINDNEFKNVDNEQEEAKREYNEYQNNAINQ